MTQIDPEKFNADFEILSPKTLDTDHSRRAFGIQDAFETSREQIIEGTYTPEGGNTDFFISVSPWSEEGRGFTVAQWPIGSYENDPEGERIKVEFRPIGHAGESNEVVFQPMGLLIKPRDVDRKPMEALLDLALNPRLDLFPNGAGYQPDESSKYIPDVSRKRIDLLIEAADKLVRREQQKRNTSFSLAKVIRRHLDIDKIRTT